MGIILVRAVILYLLTVFIMRLMGKRQIGELEPTELVTTVMVSEIATLPLQDTKLPVLSAVIAVMGLAAVEMLSGFISLHSPVYRNFLSGDYSIIINEGVIDIKEMRKSCLTLDELTEQLRRHGILSVDDVRFCILETDGNMSVIPKSSSQTSLAYILVLDGKPVKRNIKKTGLTLTDVTALAKNHGADIKHTFLMSICGDKVTVVKK